MSACIDCGAPVGPRSKTGRCRTHAMAFSNNTPEVKAKRVASWKRTLAADPAMRERLRETGRRSAAKPGEIERRRAFAKAQGIAEIGRAARTPEAFARQGRSYTETRLGHIPPHLRAEYRRLKSRHFTSEEATAMLLEQDAREVARVRQAMGAA